MCLRQLEKEKERRKDTIRPSQNNIVVRGFFPPSFPIMLIKLDI